MQKNTAAIVGAWLMLAGISLGASHARAAEGVVQARGEAMIRGGDKVAAKKAAVADALKNAIDKVVGVTVQSDFSSELKETVKNNQSDFQAAVADKVTKKSQGFIKTYEVLSEAAEGNVFKVTVRAEVFESKIKAEVKQLATLLLEAGNPRMMIVIQDVIISPDGKSRVSSTSLLGTHLESKLLELGIEVRGKRAARQVTGDLNGFDRWSRKTDAIAEMAQAEGADILVFGRVELHDKGEIKNATFASLNGQRRVEIVATVRGMLVAGRQLVSAQPHTMSSMGINLERAVYRALEGRGKNLITRVWDPLFEDLKTAYRNMADQGSTYVVLLKNVSNFRTQGRKFVGLLRSHPQIKGLEHKYDQGLLSVEFSCKCSSEDLQNHLFEAAEGEADLKTLDLDGISGSSISFRL